MRISDWSSDVCSSDLMASWMIDRFGAQPVKDKYLPDLVTMAPLASYCLTEPSSGSDAAALRTKAVRDGAHYVVTGTKQFLSGGGDNDLYVVIVRTGEEGQGHFVPGDRKGHSERKSAPLNSSH